MLCLCACTHVCVLCTHSTLLYTALEASSVELIDRYGTVLLEQLNPTSFATIMHDRRLLGNEDYRIINSAATEYQKNSYILARVQNMDNCGLLRFVDILQSLDHQQHIGMPLINGMLKILVVTMVLIKLQYYKNRDTKISILPNIQRKNREFEYSSIEHYC